MELQDQVGRREGQSAVRNRWRPRLELAGALVVYVLLASWLMGDVLRTPSQTLIGVPSVSDRYRALADSDQAMVLANVMSAARSLVSHPADFWDNRQCHPFPNSRTLGEPMIIDGLLAAVPLAVTGEPILALNLVYLLRIVAAGVAMFVLVRYCTGSAGAAFVAGLLFGFEPHRIRDLAHPYIASSALGPMAILFAVRLVETLRWRVAAALGVVLGLQIAESFYPTVALGLVGGSCGVGLLLHARDRLWRLAPRLLLVGALTLLGVAMVYGPFLKTRAAWDVLQGRLSLLHVPAHFAYGGPAFPGVVLLLLAAVGLVHRVFGRRGIRDLRIPLVVGAALVFWLVVTAVPVPWIGPVPSPYVLGLRSLPGFDSVRAIPAIRVGIYLAGTALAGFGVAALLRGRGTATRIAIVVLLSFLAAGELFFGEASGRPFATRYEGNLTRPAPRLLEALDRLPDGPVVNVPPGGWIGITVNAHALFLSAFHGRAVDTCGNSFVPPLRREVERIARALPASSAIVGLAALGFRGVVVHTEYLSPERTTAFREAAAKRTASWASMREVADAEGHILYAISSDRPHTGDVHVLTRSAWPREGRRPVAVSGARDDVDVSFYNPTMEFFAVTMPIVPLVGVATWRDESDLVVSAEQVRFVPPLSIPPRDWRVRSLPLAIPRRPGSYTLALEVMDAEPWEISRVPVVVRPAEGDQRR